MDRQQTPVEAARKVSWAEGENTGLRFPTHPIAFHDAGPAFLTEAFRAAGALSTDQSVAEIISARDCPGGSTGRKLFLSVRYDPPSPALHTDLFAKFSRDFDDPIRDRGKEQMQSEARFALLSRAPDFPITAPTCYFADYHAETGSGLLITEQVPFGQDGVEPHYNKCLDHLLPEPLEHYEALIGSVARLAGAHHAGGLGADIGARFPFDPAAAIARDPIRYDGARIERRIAAYAEFAADYPNLLPAPLRTPAFLEKLRTDTARFLAREQDIKKKLHAPSDLIALCHWNANVDNGWFWRGADGRLQCGLMDWGHVGQMNVALALWGALSAADPDFLARELDGLFDHFISTQRAAGGPDILPARLKQHFCMFVATMGLAWLMDAPALIRRELPDLDPGADRYDPWFAANEMARTQLIMFTNVLSLWAREDFGAVLTKFLGADDEGEAA